MRPNRNVDVVPVQVPANAPYLPPRIHQEEAFALKALVEGKANPDEQGMAIRCILNTICEVDRMSYRSDDRDHAFADGKRFVAHHILMAFRMTPEQITNLPKFGTTSVSGEADEIHDR